MKRTIACVALALLAGCASPQYRNMHEVEDPAQVDTLSDLLRDWTDASGEISCRMRTLQSQIEDLRDTTKSQTEEAGKLQRELDLIMQERMESLRLEEELIRELDRLQRLDREQRKALIQKVNQFMDELRAQPAPRPAP